MQVVFLFIISVRIEIEGIFLCHCKEDFFLFQMVNTQKAKMRLATGFEQMDHILYSVTQIVQDEEQFTIYTWASSIESNRKTYWNNKKKYKHVNACKVL